MNIVSLDNIVYTPQTNSFLKKEKEFKLSNISFEIAEEETSAVVGESGSGKTTLGKLLAGILEPDSGDLKINVETKEKISPVQFLFQNSGELINPYRTVKDYLLYPDRKEGEIKETITKLKLDQSILEKKNGNLSGGERQRVALAGLLLAKPKLLILDEPFSAQDIASQKNIKELLLRIKSEFKLTMVIISHNVEILKDLADSLIVMYKGIIVESGNFESVIEEPLHPYTKFLLRAAQFDLSEDEFEFRQIPVDSAVCKYYNVCPIRIDTCKEKVTLAEKENHKVYCNRPGEF